MARLAGADPSKLVSILTGYVERDEIVGASWNVAVQILQKLEEHIDRPRLRRILRDTGLSLWARTIALELLGPAEDARARTRLDHLEMAHLHTAILVIYASNDPKSARFLTTMFPPGPAGWGELLDRIEECRWPLGIAAATVYAGILGARRLRKIHGRVREIVEASTEGRRERKLKMVHSPSES